MGQRDLDKYFKDGLKGYSKEMDTDAIWSGLDLEEKKKKKPFFLWFLGFFLILFFSATYFTSDKFDTQENVQVVTEEIVGLQNNAEDKKSAPIAKVKDHSKTEIEAPAKAKSFSNVIQPSNTKKVNKNRSTQINNTANLITTSRTTNSVKSNNKSITPLGSNSDFHNNKIKDLPTNENSDREIINQKTFAVSAQLKQDMPFMKTSDLQKELLIDNKLMVSQSLETLEINPVDLFPIPNRTKPNLNLKTSAEKNNKKSNGLSLNIYSGLYKINRTLRADSTQFKEFVSAKENIETPLELIAVGSQLKYDVGSIYFKAGVEFQSLNVQFKYNQTEVLDTVLAPGIANTFVDTNGDSTNQTGIVLSENTLTDKWLHYNNYRLISIPLSIGYEKEFNKWFLSLEAQTLLNFHRSFSGKRLDSNNTVTDDSDTIHKSFKVGFGVSVGARYAFTNTTSVYVRPHYFRYQDSFDGELGDYSQQYDMYGLQVGLNYRLF